MSDSEMLAVIRALLPDTYSDSKDWRTGNVTERIIWLKAMLESKTREIEWFLDMNEKNTDRLYAEIERLEKACDDWAEVSQSNYQRAKAAEAKLAKAVDGLKECEAEIDAYIQYEYPHDHPIQERCRQRDYAANPARTTLAEIKKAKP